VARDAPAFLKGRRPSPCRGPSPRGLVSLEDLLYRFPLRDEERSQPSDDCVAEARADSLDRRPRGSRADCGRRPPRVSRSSKSRSTMAAARCARLVQNQPFPSRHLHARSARSCCTARLNARLRQPAAHEPAVRDHRREDGETIHTGASCRCTKRTGTITPKMQRRLVYDALQRLPADLPITCPRRSGSAAAAVRGMRRSSPALSAGGRSARCADLFATPRSGA